MTIEERIKSLHEEGVPSEITKEFIEYISVDRTPPEQYLASFTKEELEALIVAVSYYNLHYVENSSNDNIANRLEILEDVSQYLWSLM